MNKNKKQELTNQHVKNAKKLDWDSLAFSIIELEQSLSKEKDSKQLELLNLKLKIYEAEKFDRIFDSFNMEYFLSKEMGLFEDEDYDFSDI